MYRNNIRAVLDDNCSVNLGAVYESVVAQELAAHGHPLYYYDNKHNGEVDYHIDHGIVLSKSREVRRNGGITYLPVYYVMFMD